MLQDPTTLTIFVSLLLCTLSLRMLLIIAGQNWVRTYAHTLTIVLLPMITYSITVVIAGSIALSLGMVGALSIVRFRNPVKSPFELVVFFLLVTMGISAGTNLVAMLLLTATTMLVLLGFKIVDISFRLFLGRDFFQVSFSEGSELPTLEIECSEELIGFFDHNQIISFSKQENQYTYVLASRQKSDLTKIVDALDSNQKVQSVRLSTH